jgi:ribose transport system substrate-binding protein
MNKRSARRSWRSAPAVLALAVLATACGSGNGGDDGAPAGGEVDEAAMAKAQAVVDEYMAAPTYEGPTTPVDLSKVRGKTVYFVAFDLSNAFNQSILDHFKEAAGLMGLKVVALSGQVNPALETQHVNQAVRDKAAAIVLLSIGSEQIPAALKNAADAGIPVITMAQRSAGEDPGENITNQVTVNTTEIGKAQVDYAFTQSDGYVNAVGYGGKSLPQDVSQWEGQEARIKELCPDTCEYKSNNIDLTTFQTQLPGVARAAITADKDLNWFLPTWDILGTYVLPGIEQAKATDRVRFSSWNGIPAAMELVQQGKQAATFGVPLRWWGWATADMTARYIEGQDVAPDAENLPVRLFTKELLDEIGTVDDETKLYEDAAAIDTYRKLWGLQ